VATARCTPRGGSCPPFTGSDNRNRCRQRLAEAAKAVDFSDRVEAPASETGEPTEPPVRRTSSASRPRMKTREGLAGWRALPERSEHRHGGQSARRRRPTNSSSWARVAIDDVCDLAPEDVFRIVGELIADSPGGDVGDGVNDAPALAAAPVASPRPPPEPGRPRGRPDRRRHPRRPVGLLTLPIRHPHCEAIPSSSSSETAGAWPAADGPGTSLGRAHLRRSLAYRWARC